MRWHSLACTAFLSVLVAFGLIGPSSTGPATAGWQVDPSPALQGPTPPRVAVAGLQLADRVRYSVTVSKPDVLALQDVRVDVVLPADADVLEAWETPGRTQFLGHQGARLAWAAPRFGPQEPVDAFTFVLRQAASAPLEVRVRWEGERPADIALSVQPAVATATRSSGGLVVGADNQGTTAPVGESGVVAKLTPGSVPLGTMLQVERLGADADPPRETAPLWWCAVVEVDGVPPGDAVDLQVPARQPMPPGADVSLVVKQGERWVEAMALKASVTDDGQFIALRHPGGVVAAGIAANLQPRAARGLD
jgi:hypothetical protein